jgi:hypothetical protein
MASFEKSSYTDYNKYKEARKIERKRRRERAKDFYKTLQTPCIFCGCENDIQFHHVNPTEKSFDITTSTNKKEIMKEAKKCWCLCKSCHQKLHQRLCDPLPSAYDTVETVT